MPLGIPMEALFLLNMLVGDVVVVIRAKIIWGTGWRIVAIPLIFLFATLGFSMTSIACLTASIYTQKRTSVPTGSYVCRWAEPIAWALSLLTNVVSTSLIAYRAWAHRKDLAHLHGMESRQSGVERVLRLLVDSGFIYFLFLLTQVVLFIESGNELALGWAFAILAPLGDQISGIYCTSVIILVVLQRSNWASTVHNTATFPNCKESPGASKTLTCIEFGNHATSTNVSAFSN
ncbi:hypothetical protein DL96DRAFT_1819573 [Flagelloscypha sp. PMI_526]|nr:hypothetical protein DL96DRAFT_1819573 [Flagelloscypha sp. PMI_526]